MSGEMKSSNQSVELTTRSVSKFSHGLILFTPSTARSRWRWLTSVSLGVITMITLRFNIALMTS
jgi:hypothetical protein